jgi:hypothetical protein
MDRITENVEMTAFQASFVVLEPLQPEMPTGSVAVFETTCGNPNCKTGCPNSAILLALPDGSFVSFRFEPEAAEDLAGAILLSAVKQAAKLNPTRQ